MVPGMVGRRVREIGLDLILKSFDNQATLRVGELPCEVEVGWWDMC